jgi:class 3 adenylate cyclase/tetratricopeptide (TPR) repeat protein
MTVKTAIIDSFNRGDLSRAYDLCVLALRETPDDLWLRHRAVLCLVRSGALERAEEEYLNFRLSEAQFDEDCLALGARLFKARTLEASPAEFGTLAGLAAAKYADVFTQTGGHYPGINAASMHFLAGDLEQARHRARQVLNVCSTLTDGLTPEESYYRLASQAEAHLLLGDQGAAHIALRAAVALDPENRLAHATTIQQMRLILMAQDRTAAWLTEIEPPRPCHFAGHLFRPGDHESGLVSEIDAALEHENIGSAFGAIAAGSDILIAESLRRLGGELHIVLPLPVGAFIDASVAPFGVDWVRRCEACLGEASSIQELTTGRRRLTAPHVRFASDVAMGLARIRADVLATKPVQLLVWDGTTTQGPHGTAHDARIWKAAGLPQATLSFPAENRVSPQPLDGDLERSIDGHSVLRAMIFVDVRGSTMIADDDVPIFVEQVLGRLADTCAKLETTPVYSDSWGDGLFLAFEDVLAAADAAHQLRTAFSELDLEALGLPDALALRIGGHFGPIHEGQDRVQNRVSLFGRHVALASRIEGVAVPGSILVSAPFAALLAMSDSGGYRSEYVGQKQIDPLLPEIPVYSLRAVVAGSVAAQRMERSIRSAEPV